MSILLRVSKVTIVLTLSILSGCESDLGTNISADTSDDGKTVTEVGTDASGQPPKFLTTDCVDPKLHYVTNEATLTLCDGSNARGTADLKNLTPMNIVKGITINGILGLYEVQIPNLLNVRTIDTVGGVQGKLVDCTANGQTDCVTSDLFPAVKKADILPSSLLSGFSLLGVQGSHVSDFPEPQNVLSLDSTNGVTGTVSTCETEFSRGCFKPAVTRFAKIGEISLGGSGIYPFDVFIRGNRAYVTGGPKLGILDISDKTAPTLITSINVPNGEYSVSSYVAGALWIIAAGSDGVRAIDISKETNPTFIGSYDELYGWVDEINFGEGLVHIAYGNGNSDWINVANPASPVRIGGISHPNSMGGGWGPRAFSRVRNKGFIGYASTAKDLQVVDLTDPSIPVHLGLHAVTNGVEAIAVKGGTVYIAGLAEGLLTVDASNPAAMTRVDAKNLADDVIDVELIGDSYLAVLGTDNLHLFDISSSPIPTFISKFELSAALSSPSFKFFVDGDYVYLNDGVNNLVILKLTN